MSATQKTVLIVDDDLAILESLQLLLELNDYVVVTTTGEDVQYLVDNHQPDIILLDLWMGSLSGKHLCQQLRANTALDAVPIIIVSASTDIQHSFEEVGATDYIEKPFDIDALIEKIETLTQ